MKVHKEQTNSNETITKEDNACCETTSSKTSDPCCEQPIDGSTCCDKNATQVENSKSTGCC